MASSPSVRDEFSAAGVSLLLLAVSSNFLWGLLYKGFGVLLPALNDQFPGHTWVVGVTVAASSVFSDVVGLFVMPIDARLGSGPLALLSAVLVGLGMLLVPMARSILHIGMALVFITGVGFGFMNVLNKTLLARHFSAHFGLACGIGQTGGTLVLVVMAPLVQLFLDTYGWRGASLLAAGIIQHMLVAAALVHAKWRRGFYRGPLPTQSPDDAGDHREGREEGRRSVRSQLCLRLLRDVHPEIVLSADFWAVCSIRVGLVCVTSAWMLYYVPHAQQKGISPAVAAGLCTASAAGHLVGSLAWTPAVDRGLVRCSTGIVVNCLCLCLSFLVDPWVSGVAGQAVLGLLFGLSHSALYTLADVLTRDALGGRFPLATAFGWIRVCNAPARILGGFFPGWIFDYLGSYDWAFIALGIIPCASLIPLVIRLLQKRL